LRLIVSKLQRFIRFRFFGLRRIVAVGAVGLFGGGVGGGCDLTWWKF